MSFNEFIIQVKGLSKSYQIYNRPQDRLKQSIIPRLQALTGRQQTTYFHNFWALRDVSFEVKKGETVGIIGRNGSGKSTLLQLICGTLTPTHGSVLVNGRLAALLELGSGFNPEFTGRENVYLNGTILGLSKNEIDAGFEDIAAFADIGEFIEQPVKMYSSGMYVRLAFAINIMSKPDIMIVDEALAVGDMKFQAKCMTALRRRQESGTTVLFVSHDIGTVKSLCSRAIYLERGEVKSMGSAADVVTRYIRVMQEEINHEQDHSGIPSTSMPEAQQDDISSNIFPSQGSALKNYEEFNRRVALFRYGTGEARIMFVELLNAVHEPISLVEFNQEVKIRIHFQAYEQKTLSVNFVIMDDKKYPITSADLSAVGQSAIQADPGDGFQVDYLIRLPLQEGKYSVRVSLTEALEHSQGARFIDVIDDATVFSVYKGDMGKIWSKVFLFPSVEIKAISQEHKPA